MRWTILLDTVIVEGLEAELPKVEWMVTLCDFYDGSPVSRGQAVSVGKAFDKAVKLALFDVAEAAEEEIEGED